MKQPPKTIRDFVRRAAMTLAVMLMIATAAWADSAFSGGAGTTGNPYQIARACSP